MRLNHALEEVSWRFGRAMRCTREGAIIRCSPVGAGRVVPKRRQRTSEVGSITGTASPARKAREVSTGGVRGLARHLRKKTAVPWLGQSTEASVGNTAAMHRVRRREIARIRESTPSLPLGARARSARRLRDVRSHSGENRTRPPEYGGAWGGQRELRERRPG
jgi:hypothetical protein